MTPLILTVAIILAWCVHEVLAAQWDRDPVDDAEIDAFMREPFDNFGCEPADRLASPRSRSFHGGENTRA